MIDLTVNESVLASAIEVARARDFKVPTFKQMQNPELIPASIKTQLGGAVSEPATRRLTRIQVVRRELLRVVATRLGAFQRRHPHRHRATPTLSPQVCTRLSFRTR